MSRYYEPKAAPERGGAEPPAVTMEEFAARERVATLERAKRLNARNEKQQRAIAGDAAVDRLKEVYGR